MGLESQSEGVEMIDQEKLDRIRARAIKELEGCINDYTASGPWVNEKYTRDLIAKLQNKEPVTPAPVLWLETIDDAIRDEGFSGQEWELYWKALTEGR